MNYSIKTIPQFDKQMKRMVKKYPSFKDDFIPFIQSLRQTPEQGTPIGKNCYKTRIAIAAKSKGKSGGARVLTFLKLNEITLLLFSIYDKSEKSTLSEKEIKLLIKDYL